MSHLSTAKAAESENRLSEWQQKERWGGGGRKKALVCWCNCGKSWEAEPAPQQPLASCGCCSEDSR